VQAIRDKKDCINAIAEGAKVYRVEQIAAEIDRIFSDANVENAVVLSSVHKSKGLEADNVYIIVPDKLPMVWKNQLPWQYEQECNLHYVAITRAKQKLTYVALTEEDIKSATL
jgi:superfamily I DNA/RNA helicase